MPLPPTFAARRLYVTFLVSQMLLPLHSALHLYHTLLPFFHYRVVHHHLILFLFPLLHQQVLLLLSLITFSSAALSTSTSSFSPHSLPTPLLLLPFRLFSPHSHPQPFLPTPPTPHFHLILSHRHFHLGLPPLIFTSFFPDASSTPAPSPFIFTSSPPITYSNSSSFSSTFSPHPLPLPLLPPPPLHFPPTSPLPPLFFFRFRLTIPTSLSISPCYPLSLHETGSDPRWCIAAICGLEPPSSPFKSVSAYLWVINPFQPDNPFPTDEMPRTSTFHQL